ncbi:methyltransferase domain-containing protein [Methylobrevis pamukkalensis]|uniref:Ubiquinone biosynthesis O-methyltransferase n=1 Tax=Methylobrevis pamukkalensis TaxID=1439726 RepID=A0A1E3H012_9HYPH|nr:methyltransferase domain-containing protein [Methylobrevis pamukkalensis]ODN69647.1 Ubiquinone biosynthesis O-methyltransferase [Methylobrevis pamukkalensis]
MPITQTTQSSGDLLADRRFEYARMLAADGDAVAAADLYAQALELVPGWAAGWFALGEAREQAGDRNGAGEAFRRLDVLDPTGVFGAPLRLALLGAEPVPETAPAAYVRALFDDYADRFETALVGDLDYQAPQLIAAALASVRPGPVGRVLDLGCGTGLMAEAVAGRVASIEGVDLSADMVAAARAKGLYADLRIGEVVADLAAGGPSYEVILAADVFVYIGDLGPVLGAAAGRLGPGGLLAFTVERHDGEGWSLRPSLRYAHGEPLIRELGARHGFRVARLSTDRLRTDRGDPVIGLVVVLERLP